MEELKKGQKAPDFTATDQSGNPIKLSNYKGSKVILYFYPKDNTPGCNAEACSLRDGYDDLLSKGFKIIGVSPDNLKSHQNFTEKFSLPFPLIPDTGKEIIKAYGVWGRKKFMGKEYDGVFRTTFIIDEEGNIESIINKVDTKKHAVQILNL
ncbi:MAG: thioredoxin-dependent thiol peroxidase [Lentimicrobium sp.]|jgi:peroxiredoxin Q/BCP|nr:thioredoxin-dependent thiol peroxidase [Lentimicrobium sp.]